MPAGDARPPAQATVSAFDATTRAGRVLLDAGVELAFTSDALQGSGLRLLRRGQRVRLVVAEETDGEHRPRIAAVRLLTLPGNTDLPWTQ